MSAPLPFGLLMDVEGPVAGPLTRTVAAPLLDDLRTLLGAGIPVALNTGRSAAFVAERVLTPLLAAGLPPGARLHAVCEKGGVWRTAGSAGVHVDAALGVPEVCGAVVAELMADGVGDAMFDDDSKRTMATVGARTDVPGACYADRRRAFDAELLTHLAAPGSASVSATSTTRTPTVRCPAPGTQWANGAPDTPWPTSCTHSATRSRTSTSAPGRRSSAPAPCSPSPAWSTTQPAPRPPTRARRRPVTCWSPSTGTGRCSSRCRWPGPTRCPCR